MRKTIATIGFIAICQTAASAQQQYTDQQICDTLQALSTQSNKDAGTRVDNITTHLGMAVMCNMKVVDFRKRLDVPMSQLEPGWQDRKQRQWNEIYCKNEGFARLIVNGWTISNTLTDTEDKRHVMRAKCN